MSSCALSEIDTRACQSISERRKGALWTLVVLCPLHWCTLCAAPCCCVPTAHSADWFACLLTQPLRRLCNAVAPTSNTKKTHLFTRRTPIAQNTNAGSYVTLAEALAVLGVHLGSEQHFTELVVQVSAAAFAAAKRAA